MVLQTKILGFDVPKDFDSKYSSIINSTSSKIEKVLKNISAKTGDNSKKSNSVNSYNQYILMEILNRATTNVLENFHSK